MTLLLCACSTERKVAKKIDGIWTITSFQGTQDSLNTDFYEFMDSLFSEATIQFYDYNLRDSEGIYELTLVDAISGESDQDSGTYVINEEGNRITLVRLNEEDILDLNVGSESLSMEGPYLGSTVRIEAVY